MHVAVKSCHDGGLKKTLKHDGGWFGRLGSCFGGCFGRGGGGVVVFSGSMLVGSFNGLFHIFDMF